MTGKGGEEKEGEAWARPGYPRLGVGSEICPVLSVRETFENKLSTWVSVDVGQPCNVSPWQPCVHVLGSHVKVLVLSESHQGQDKKQAQGGRTDGQGCWESAEGAVSTALLRLQKSQESLDFPQDPDWDLNRSYLDLKGAWLPQLPWGPHFKWGLLNDVMEQMTKFLCFPYACALNCY